MIFGLALTLAIPSGFGRSRIRRNCGYTLLPTVFFHEILFKINDKTNKNNPEQKRKYLVLKDK